ncbi:MAG: cell envelope integrity protein CreD [Reyranellaceae bacterium]
MSQSAADQPVPPPSRLFGLKPSALLTLKAMLVGGLTLALLIPLYMVWDAIDERHNRYNEAVREIGRAWGLPQRLAGPTLLLPYTTSERDKEGTVRVYRHQLRVLPETMTIAASAAPEVRYRGLFEAVVYVVDLDIYGEFLVPDLAEHAPTGTLDPAGIAVQLGVSDPRSIALETGLLFGDRTLTLEPASDAILGGVLSGRLGAQPGPGPGERIPYRIKLKLNGSESLSFLPLGRETRVSVAAPWPSPSFFGAWLPAERSIGERGFEASWRVSYLGRSYGQAWNSTDIPSGLRERVHAGAFGVNFLQTVTPYRETERAIKYGILFIALTFVMYLMFEMVSGRPIHLLQYGAVGLSLCVFYLLLLSLSEQLGFFWAYAVSATAIVGQTTAYTLAATRRKRFALGFGGGLSGLYAFLYVLMQMESYSLLSGAIALFLVLSALMWMTRNLNRMAMPGAQTRAT